MGCLSSRPTTVSPVDSSGSSSVRANNKHNGQSKTNNNSRYIQNSGQEYNNANKQVIDIGTSFDKEVDGKRSTGSNSLNETPEDDIMSILLADHDKHSGEDGGGGGGGTTRRKGGNHLAEEQRRTVDDISEENQTYTPSQQDRSELEREDSKERNRPDNDTTVASPSDVGSRDPNEQPNDDSKQNSFDDELNMDLLRQYIVVDYEITQLEDKDALRIYHEKIEQLEQLERELDMISAEAEEVAARNEMGLSQMDRFTSSNGMSQADGKIDLESNSMLSGVTGSMSSIKMGAHGNLQSQGQQTKSSRNQANSSSFRKTSSKISNRSKNNQEQSLDNLQSSNQVSSAAYSTIEEVFNRKIILEKERDKLKKEVEYVIIECDKLQQKYKKRDEILDKLFDGRTGNGLENHLEQQLNWLMEQKHYVDQVFYAWKRAETLTNQTCEQFASALELLKRLPKLQSEEQRSELAKSIAQLLIKSRQDMEQAQRYNPNVDAPFFTDTETERFDKIIETISQPQSLTQSEYSQIATVIQFAYKRTVSIRLWLEQILQITIARDSFELAEEYKWIAIQLRKERITLINSKLQEAPYRSMAQSVREQIAFQQQRQAAEGVKSAAMISDSNGMKGEINRDSGVESDDIDIEEEIYRLLEMNKSRLEASVAMQQDSQLANKPSIGLGAGQASAFSASLNNEQKRDEIMRERIQRRVRGEQPYAMNGQRAPPKSSGDNGQDASKSSISQSAATSASTPSKLRVELDEATRQSLLKQVDQIHAKHRSKMESLRGNNKAKANDFISNRMQQVRNQPNAEKE